MEQVEERLSLDELKRLRASGDINENEIAIKIDDIVIAENVVTRERRMLGYTNEILRESNKRLLKG